MITTYLRHTYLLHIYREYYEHYLFTGSKLLRSALPLGDRPALLRVESDLQIQKIGIRQRLWLGKLYIYIYIYIDLQIQKIGIRQRLWLGK